MNRAIQLLVENKKIVIVVLLILSAIAIYQFGKRVGEFTYLITH